MIAINTNTKQKVVRYLDQLGIPHHLKGFDYSARAISACMTDYANRNKLMALYAEIAHDNKCKWETVERNIRFARESVGVKKKNIEFICSIADYLMYN
jgi:DNA-dependent RNA polymerase auxiliary subunit epsilon